MSKKLILLITLAAALALLVTTTRYLTEPEEADADVGQAEQADWSAQMPGEQPSADNVDQSFMAQVHELEQYLQEHPADTTHLVRIARLYQDGHKPGKAIAYYKRYLDINSQSEQIWLDLASCYGATGDWKGAEEATQQLLDFSPDNVSALYNLGAILANTGRPQQAADQWHRVLKLDTDPEVTKLARQSLKRLTRPDAAMSQ